MSINNKLNDDRQRSSFKHATNRRFDLELKRELDQVGQASAREIKIWKEERALKPLDEQEFTSKSLAPMLQAERQTDIRKSIPVFHDDLTYNPIAEPHTLEKPARATEFLAKVGLDPRSLSTSAVTSINVLLQGQTLVKDASTSPKIEPITEVQAEQHLSSPRMQQSYTKDYILPTPPCDPAPCKPAIVKTAGTAQCVYYQERKRRVRYNVKLKKGSSSSSSLAVTQQDTMLPCNERLLDDLKEGTHLEEADTSIADVSNKAIPNMADLVNDARRFTMTGENEAEYVKKRQKRMSSRLLVKRRGTSHALHPSVPRERTVDDIVAELRAQFRLGGMTEADKRIQQLVNEVMSRTGGEQEPVVNTPVCQSPTLKDEEVPREIAIEVLAVSHSRETILESIKSETTEVSTIPPPISITTSTQEPPEPTLDDIHQYFDVKQAWEDLTAPAKCSTEDLLGIKGKTASINKHHVSFLVAWLPADDTTNMDDDVREVTQKHKREPIHHFCQTSNILPLQSDLANVGVMYHTPSKYNRGRQHTRIQVALSKSPTKQGTSALHKDNAVNNDISPTHTTRTQTRQSLTPNQMATIHERESKFSTMSKKETPTQERLPVMTHSTIPHLPLTSDHIINDGTIRFEDDMTPEASVSEWKLIAEQSVMSDALEITGKKMPFNSNVSRIFWTMAPGKLGMPPSRVKDVLFPEYR